MRIKALLAALAFPLMAFAQAPGKPPPGVVDKYNVFATVDPLEKYYDSKLPGYYVTKDGKRTDCLILFETADKMNSYDTELNTSLAQRGVSTMVDKNSLLAFLVNDRLYSPAVVKDTLKWVKLNTQGAIRVVMSPFYKKYSVRKEYKFWWDEEKQTKVGYWDTLSVSIPRWDERELFQKLGNPAENIISFSRKKMMKWVAENENLSSKIENKEEGYKNSLSDIGYKERMFGMYNNWYDEQNPGKISYYDTIASFVAPDKPILISTAAIVSKVEEPPPATTSYQQKEIKEVEKAHRAPRLDVFKGRPDVASAAVASAKPEVAVKKESFKERLNRIKADGNNVGVLVTSKNCTINPNDFAEGIRKARVVGSYGPLEGLDLIARKTAEDLNAGFGIDVFEAVDYSQIPVKEGKYGKMDDWWSTKYKVIVLYKLTPSYVAYTKIVDSKTFERNYFAQMKVEGEMIVMSAEEIKPEKLRYVTSSPKSWGYYRSEKFTGQGDTTFDTIQELKAAIEPAIDEDIIEAIIKSQKEYLDKFVKKKSK